MGGKSQQMGGKGKSGGKDSPKGHGGAHHHHGKHGKSKDGNKDSHGKGGDVAFMNDGDGPTNRQGQYHDHDADHNTGETGKHSRTSIKNEKSGGDRDVDDLELQDVSKADGARSDKKKKSQHSDNSDNSSGEDNRYTQDMKKKQGATTRLREDIEFKRLNSQDRDDQVQRLLQPRVAPPVRRQSHGFFEEFKAICIDLFGTMNVEVVRDDCDALPALHPTIIYQYKWIQYLVWRKWLLHGAFVISIMVLALDTYSFVIKIQSVMDQHVRCLKGAIETEFDNLPRNTSLKQLRYTYGKRNEDWRAFYYVMKGKKKKKPTGFAAGQAFSAAAGLAGDSAFEPDPKTWGTMWSSGQDEEYPIYNVFNEHIPAWDGSRIDLQAATIGECQWFAYAPWTKKKREPKMPPSFDAASLAKRAVSERGGGDADTAANAAAAAQEAEAALGVNTQGLSDAGGSMLSFFTAAKDIGCDAKKKKQYSQRESCICSISMSVFNSDLSGVMDDKGFFYEQPEKAAGVRQFMVFVNPRHCQNAVPKNETAYAEQIAKEYNAGASSKLEPVSNPAKGVAPVYIDNTRCMVEVKSRSSDGNNPARNGYKVRYAGLRGQLGNLKLCYYSVAGSLYAPNTGFPPHVERECCTPAEFIQVESTWVEMATETYNVLQSGATFWISVNSIASAFLAAWFWRNWYRSSKLAFWAFIAPFLINFVIYSIPYKAWTNVSFRNASDRVANFAIQQIGFTSKKELYELSEDFIADTLRGTMINFGVGNMFKGVQCPHLLENPSLVRAVATNLLNACVDQSPDIFNAWIKYSPEANSEGVMIKSPMLKSAGLYRAQTTYHRAAFSEHEGDKEDGSTYKYLDPLMPMDVWMASFAYSKGSSLGDGRSSDSSSPGGGRLTFKQVIRDESLNVGDPGVRVWETPAVRGGTVYAAKNPNSNRDPDTNWDPFTQQYKPGTSPQLYDVEKYFPTMDSLWKYFVNDDMPKWISGNPNITAEQAEIFDKDGYLKVPKMDGPVHAFVGAHYSETDNTVTSQGWLAAYAREWEAWSQFEQRNAFLMMALQQGEKLNKTLVDQAFNGLAGYVAMASSEANPDGPGVVNMETIEEKIEGIKDAVKGSFPHDRRLFDMMENMQNEILAGNRKLVLDCKWAADGTKHPSLFAKNGLCDLPGSLGMQIRGLCCESCSLSYFKSVQSIDDMYKKYQFPEGNAIEWKDLDRMKNGMKGVVHPYAPSMGGDPVQWNQLTDRLRLCDPIGYTKRMGLLPRLGSTNGTDKNAEYWNKAKWQMDGQNVESYYEYIVDKVTDGKLNSKDWNYFADKDVDIWQLGAQCRNLTGGTGAGTAGSDCFDYYTYMMPMTMDPPIPNNIHKMIDLVEQMYKRFLDGLVIILDLVTRLKQVLASLIALFPIVFAFLPGLAKGFSKAQDILPQNPIVGYFLVSVPLLNLPMLGAPLSIVCQLTASWWFFAGVMCLSTAMVIPVLAYGNSLGPHTSKETYGLWNDYIIQQYFCKPENVRKGPNIKIGHIQILFFILTGVFFIIGIYFILTAVDIPKDIDLTQLMDFITWEMIITKGLNAILNFLKGKTFTVVMSADIMFHVMIGLHKFNLLRKRENEYFSQMIAPASLITIAPEQVAEVKAKYDQDNDGNFNADEIRGITMMLNPLYMAKTKAVDDQCLSVVKDSLTKILKKKGLNSEEIMEAMETTEGLEEALRKPDVGGKFGGLMKAEGGGRGLQQAIDDIESDDFDAAREGGDDVKEGDSGRGKNHDLKGGKGKSSREGNQRVRE